MGQERKGITLCEVYIKVQQEVLILFDQLQTNMNFFFIHSCDKGTVKEYPDLQDVITCGLVRRKLIYH